MNANKSGQLKTDLAWLSELLQKDAEQIDLPDSLRSENLLARIDKIAPAPMPQVVSLRRKGFAMQILPYAASFALIFFGWYHMQQNADNSLTQAVPMAPAAAAGGTLMSGKSDEEQPASSSAQRSLRTEDRMLESIPAESGSPERMGATAAQAGGDEQAAQDYDEVFASLETAYQNSQSAMNMRYSMLTGGAAKSQAQMADGAVLMNEATGMGGGAGVYQTNTQIEGVDEADIVKTDGTYIYQYRFNRNTGGAQIFIVTANGLKLLSTIDLPEYADAQMYVVEDSLVVVQSVSENAARLLAEQVDTPVSQYVNQTQPQADASSDVEVIIPDYQTDRDLYVPMTEVVVYDISSHQNPREAYRFAQDGYYVSSRLYNGMLYLVTNKQIYDPISPYLPARVLFPMVGEMKSARLLQPTDIVIAPYLQNPSYAMVTALDVDTHTAVTKAVLGMAEQIMMSTDSLFLTAGIAGGEGGWRSRDTGITRFSVKDGAIRYVSSGKVKGIIDGQFSLDEFDGNLRIATTGYDDNNKSSNNLYVLDAQMNRIGAIEGLAEGERIYSVRYRGETAYVVTFRQVDPLFVIDLSNPKQPVVKGELKIPGFSEYLHPIDSNTLIGLGMNTTVTKYGGVVEDGMKLSLFDVSDPAAPKEKASFLLGNMGSYSEAIGNHKAFLYYPQKNLIGFPAVVYTTTGATADDPWSGNREVSFSGYLIIRYSDEGFSVAGSIPSEQSQEGFYRSNYDNAIERGLYIGKTLYTVSAARLNAFSLDSFEKIGELVYPK